MKFSSLAAAAALVVSVSSQAAPVMALDYSGGVNTVRGTFANWGWSFSISEQRVVTALGLLDLGAVGLGDAHQVGIWNAAGQLLVTTTVDNAASQVASSSGVGVWRYADVASTLLAIGDYVIGAYYPSTADAFRTQVQVEDEAPWLTYGNAMVTVGAFGNQFGRPDNASVAFNPGVFGPNFLSQDAPEPASLALMLAGLSVLALAMRGRSRG
jgi:hypothetical protein